VHANPTHDRLHGEQRQEEEAGDHEGSAGFFGLRSNDDADDADA
jgi:hypothetical protein